jgi:SagB-type dehydrogenase family enzyme
MSSGEIPFELILSPQVRLDREEGALRVAAPWFEIRITAPTPGLLAAFERLESSGATADTLSEEVQQIDGPAGLFSLYGLLHPLDTAGCLSRQLAQRGKPLAIFHPLSGGFDFTNERLASTNRRQLSRFAYFRSIGGALRVQSPVGQAFVEFQEPQAVAFATSLIRPSSVMELCDAFPDLGRHAIGGLLTFLENARVLVDEGNCERPVEGKGSPSDYWEFHDLLFHMRSRRGRHHAPYGGTRSPSAFPAPPLLRKVDRDAAVALPAPDLATAIKRERPFADVIERRRSIRKYAAEPISLHQLGEFLYRVARIQMVLPGTDTDYALRPTPAGGALQELDLYPVVAQCRGLERGLYRYSPFDHMLLPIACPPALINMVLDQAWHTGNRESPINIYFGVTARCQRVFWKYQSMAYALILKDLGALYSTMYFVATAMGLAPCALGGGDSELFCKAAGLDPYLEPAVGEFLLGRAAELSP